MELSGKRKRFFDFFVALLNLNPILKILKKNIIVIALLLPKLQTVKGLVRPLSKKRSLRTLFESQHLKGSQTLMKSVWEHFYQILSTLWENLIWKTSSLVICEIFQVSVNTLTADAKYTVHDCGNLLLHIQRQLS